MSRRGTTKREASLSSSRRKVKVKKKGRKNWFVVKKD